MGWSTIRECAVVAEELSIPGISLTGGEPTLRTDLGAIIVELQDLYSGHICLTTNGYALSELYHTVNKPLHTINLSICTLSDALWKSYQNVSPEKALDAVHYIPALHKNLNVVITNDNYREIDNIISFCISSSMSLDIMFELKKYDEIDRVMQKFVLDCFLKYGSPIIQFGSTPSLTINIDSTCSVSIKHPMLTSLVKWELCHNCVYASNCFERVCSVRVYPDETVTPCLNHTIVATGKHLVDKIRNAYQILGQVTVTNISVSSLMNGLV